MIEVKSNYRSIIILNSTEENYEDHSNVSDKVSKDESDDKQETSESSYLDSEKYYVELKKPRPKDGGPLNPNTKMDTLCDNGYPN